MKEITNITVKHVVSEPGDFTHYDYILTKRGSEYIVSKFMSDFEFPYRIPIWVASKIKNINNAMIEVNNNIEFAEVNPHTLLEVCKTINSLES